MPVRDYTSEIREWAKSYPGGLWQDNAQAAAARKWLRLNSPETFRAIYYSEPESIRSGIDRRFLPDGVEAETFKNTVSGGISDAGKQIYNAVDTVTGFVPGIPGTVNWLGHSVADVASGNTSKAGVDMLKAVALGFAGKGLGKVASKYAGNNKALKKLSDLVDDLSWDDSRREFASAQRDDVRNVRKALSGDTGSAYTGYIETLPSSGEASFVDDVNELVGWASVRGEPKGSSSEIIKLDPNKNRYIGSGKESIVYSDPDNPDMVLKVMRGKAVPGKDIYTMPHFDSPEEAVSWAEGRTALKNSRPYNLVENIVGVTGDKDMGYMPVVSQKKVVPANKYYDKTGLEIDDDIKRFGERIGDRGLAHEVVNADSRTVPRRVNNAIYENDFNVVFKDPYDGKLYFETKDLRPDNVGYLEDGTLIGMDLFDCGGLLKGYKSGEPIHIKPENRGKFTALMKRTGKPASWFKAHGTPAQKKMATFALNARKWKHDEGGLIERLRSIYGDNESIKAAILRAKNVKKQ